MEKKEWEMLETLKANFNARAKSWQDVNAKDNKSDIALKLKISKETASLTGVIIDLSVDKTKEKSTTLLIQELISMKNLLKEQFVYCGQLSKSGYGLNETMALRGALKKLGDMNGVKTASRIMTDNIVKYPQ